MNAVELNKEDWVEIYYAVESKMKGVADGEYGDTTSSKRKWVKHLKSIMEKIGPDGETAIENGVESLGDEDTVTFDGPTLPGGVLVLDPDDNLTLVEEGCKGCRSLVADVGQPILCDWCQDFDEFKKPKGEVE